MKMTKLSDDSGLLEVAVEGEIRETDLPAEGNPLDTAAGADWPTRKLLLDLSKVTYMYSGGIGWLFKSNTTAKASGGKLVVHSVKPAVLQPLMFVRANRVLAIAADRAEAAQLAQSPA